MDSKLFWNKAKDAVGFLGVKMDDSVLLIVHNLSITKHKMIFNGILACLLVIFMAFALEPHAAESADQHEVEN